MTEPKYPELIAGIEIDEDGFLDQLEEGAILIRNPSARMAWSEVGDGLVLFASGQSRLVSADLRELLKMICSAEALHLENLGPWLGNDEARELLLELAKQGSLEFAADE